MELGFPAEMLLSTLQCLLVISDLFSGYLAAKFIVSIDSKVL